MVLFIVCSLYSTFRCAGKNTNSSKVEVLNTLKDRHPRLISAESIGKIKTLIQEDELAQQIWISNLKFAKELFNKKPLVYNKPDGRRLLRVSRAALERVRS